MVYTLLQRIKGPDSITKRVISTFVTVSEIAESSVNKLSTWHVADLRRCAMIACLLQVLACTESSAGERRIGRLEGAPMPLLNGLPVGFVRARKGQCSVREYRRNNGYHHFSAFPRHLGNDSRIAFYDWLGYTLVDC